MSAGYALIVAKVAMEDRTALMHVLAVHRDLPLDEAMRLLGQRPEGTVGRIQRLPVDLPEIGEVLRLEAVPRGQTMVTSTASRRERRQRDLGGRP
jgi:hypothetical protein